VTREVIIHTWCDVEFNEQIDTAARVDAQTVTWFVNGQRMEIDLCTPHQQTTALHQMDDLVLTYGRPWEDPDAPKVPARKNHGKRKPPADQSRHVLIDAHYVPGEGFYCDVAKCPRGGVVIPKIQGLRMHQLQAHSMTAPKNN
jgi:hypothetical protein